MTPQELKNSILQLAIQGRLVEQRPEEGTAEELYRQIQREKAALVKAGRIKKEKPLPEITEEEVPFEIPEGWKWVRLNSVISLLSGSDLLPDKYNANNKGIPYITGASNIEGNSVIINRWTEYPKNIAYKGDLLLTCKGTVGKTAILDENEVHIARQIMAIAPVLVNTVYVQLFIESQIAQLKTKAKSMIPGIDRTNVLNMLFPMPPLAEQRRIVAKIEELLPYIDRYEKAWSRLEDFNKRFPTDMQKSILQLAIQGKLVPQRPEEGTGEALYQQIQAEKHSLIRSGKLKKEKPLPEITPDEIPFDIPESWKWVRLLGVGSTQTGNTPAKAHPEYFGKDLPFITPGDIQGHDISYGNQALSLLGKQVARVAGEGTILQVCIGGSIGKAAISDREVSFNQQINAITPIQCSSEYLYAVLSSEYFIGTMKEKSGGTATPIINRGLWDSLLIPLPPVIEQKRIVAKLEELLPLCDRLK